MKKTWFFLILFLPTLSFSQSSQKYIGVETGFHNSSISKQLVKSYDSALGMQIGLKAMLPVNSNKLFLIAGFQATSLGTKFERFNLQSVIQSNGNVIVNSAVIKDLSRFEGRSQYIFLEFPIGFRYYFNKSRWRLFFQPTLDFSFSFREVSSSAFYVGDERLSENDYYGEIIGVRKFNFLGTASFGIEKTLSNNSLLGIAPYGMIQILEAAKESVTGSRYYALGARISYFFNL